MTARLSLRAAALTAALFGALGEAALGVIAAGRNTMPAFRASYTDQELRDLAAYVAERLAAVNN
jgi:hypothetical protein